MQIFNNEITCYVGETFDLNFKLQNKDGSPYVLPRYLSNGQPIPSFFVFSVATSVYNSTDNQTFRMWMRYDDVLKSFKYTEIIDASQLLNGTSTESIPIPDSDLYGFPGLDWNEGTETGTIYELTDYLYSYTDSDGKKRYVYFSTNAAYVNFADDCTEYNGTTLTFHLSHDITSEWGAQSYVYDLRIVAGNPVNSDGFLDDEDICHKTIIIPPTKFKVLYDINQKGGINNGDN